MVRRFVSILLVIVLLLTAVPLTVSAEEGDIPVFEGTLRISDEGIEMIKDLVAVFVGRFAKHLRIRIARLHIGVATGDAATTAILYGAASAAVAALTETLYLATRTTFPAPENGGVYADFTGSSSRVDIDIVLSMRVYGILATLVSLAYNYLKKQFLSNTKG